MYLLRAFAVWLILVAVESAQGTLRELLLAPLAAARLRGLETSGGAPARAAWESE